MPVSIKAQKYYQTPPSFGPHVKVSSHRHPLVSQVSWSNLHCWLPQSTHACNMHCWSLFVLAKSDAVWSIRQSSVWLNQTIIFSPIQWPVWSSAQSFPGRAGKQTTFLLSSDILYSGDSATVADANTTTSVDGDDDDADNTDMDYSKIYISEDLTRQRQFIFWKTRQAKKTHKIKDCWTTDGQIIIRNNANKIIPINSLNDLMNNT